MCLRCQLCLEVNSNHIRSCAMAVSIQEVVLVIGGFMQL